MKLFARMVACGVLTVMASATTAMAQKEQWLDYHTSAEGRGCESSTGPGVSSLS